MQLQILCSKGIIQSLKRIDGAQPRDGKALAVIVIFLGQIAAGTSVFNLCAFLLACLVVMLVRIYGLAGKVGFNMNRCNMLFEHRQSQNMFSIFLGGLMEWEANPAL